MVSFDYGASVPINDSVLSIQQVLAEFCRFKNLQRCSLALLHREQRLARVIASSDSPAPASWMLDLSKYPELRQVMQTGHPLAVRDVCQSPIMAEVAEHLYDQEFRALMIFPVMAGSDVVGALVLRYFESDPYIAREEFYLCQLLTTLLARLIVDLQPLTQQHHRLDMDNQHLKEMVAKRDACIFKALAAFHTPITVIHGFCSLIRDTDPQRLSPDQQEYLRKVIDTCDNMNTMMTDMLDLFRILCGKACMELSVRDLNVVIRNVCDAFWPSALDKGLQLHWNLPPRSCPAWFDASSIRRVLEGLIGNALQYTESGGQVRISVEEHADEVFVHVQDTGCGMDRPVLERLLGECTVDDALNQDTGCGLGLALCRMIVESHGGRLWAISQPGTGSTFSFSLLKSPAP